VVAIVMVLDGLHVEPWVVLAFPAWVLALSLSILVASFRRRRAGITVDSCLPPRPQQRQAAGARRTGPDRRG
jgi:hypothetical protein